jgi:DNA processing protein
MDVDARVEAWASLQLVPGLNARALFELLKSLGSPEEVCAASSAALTRCAGSDVAAAIRRGPDRDRLARMLAWLALPGHWLLAWDDSDYPKQLLATADPPPMFAYIGRRELLRRPALAVVGSRNATPQGVENAEAFAAALSDAGFTIVSGLALGIDAAAHRGGLAGPGSSIAVLGTGLDRIYPAGNHVLAEKLSEAGGLLSEFPLGSPPLRVNFPRRNRVISGLTRGVLVVEATLNSGSLITARLAAEQGREVFAIPGSIHSPFSKGTHRLIKEGAKLVETARDILDELGMPGQSLDQGAGTAAERGAAVGGDAVRVLTALGHEAAAVDILSERTGLTAEAIAAALVELELSGTVASLPGGVYQRLR